MTIVKVNSIGWVGDRDTITAGEIDGIDQNLAYALDGTGGGTYAPAAPLIVNGSGFQANPLIDSVLTGSLQLSGNDCHVAWRLDNTTLDHATVNGGLYVVRTSQDEWHTVNDWGGSYALWLARTTGAPQPLDGDRIRIRHIQHIANRVLNLWENDGGGVQVAALTPGVSFDDCWVDVVYDGTNWFCDAWGAAGTASVTVLR